jgi:hypothetical protein
VASVSVCAAIVASFARLSACSPPAARSSVAIRSIAHHGRTIAYRARKCPAPGRARGKKDWAQTIKGNCDTVARSTPCTRAYSTSDGLAQRARSGPAPGKRRGARREGLGRSDDHGAGVGPPFLVGIRPAWPVMRRV